jgi:hypothetical protein
MLIQTRSPRPTDSEKPPGEQKLVRSVAPRDLEALGFLPENTALVLAVHVAEIRAAGKTDEYGQQALGLARQLGLEKMEKRTGLRLADCDHLVVGLSTDQQVKLTCVLQTGQPYDRDGLATAAGARREADFRDRPVYSVRWKKTPATLLWCAGPRILVAVSGPHGATIEDLHKLPAQPRTGRKKLPLPLQTLFKERPLGVGTPLWAAGHFKDADMVSHWLARVPALKDYDDILEQIQTFGVGIRLERAIILNAELQGRDEASAQTLAGLLGTLKKPVRELVSKEIGWNVTRNAKDNWVDLQVKAKR